jgi:hypothetical protein
VQYCSSRFVSTVWFANFTLFILYWELIDHFIVTIMPDSKIINPIIYFDYFEQRIEFLFRRRAGLWTGGSVRNLFISC